MSVKEMFNTTKSNGVPAADAVTHHGTKAYKLEDRHALAQFACTGTMGGTFYANADEQVDKVLELANKCSSEFLLKTAVYARRAAFMKDMPALLVAVVAARGDVNGLLKQAFPKVIDNGRMLRNFVQIIRSGKLGRSSFGTSLKHLIQNYLSARSDEQLFKDSIGNDPSLKDIVKMVHPRPATKRREALYAYLLGKKYQSHHLPPVVQGFEQFKAGTLEGDVPAGVDFRMLTSLSLTTDQWVTLALNGNWQFVRMNLNTFARNGVFKHKKNVAAIAAKLADKDEVARARVFPYQLLMAYRAATGSTGTYSGGAVENIPSEILEALQSALDASIDNVTEIPGKIVVGVDVSGSMSSPVTGTGHSHTSAVRCVDVAGLIAASLLHKNKGTRIIPFNTVALETITGRAFKLNPRDSVITNADKLADLLGGGTNCSAPLELLVNEKADVDLFVFVSDNESWADKGYGQGTATMTQWTKLKKLNPKAKLVCIDLAANTMTQAKERRDVLNVGGFSDTIFNVVNAFVEGGSDTSHWVSVIEGVELESN